MTYRNWEELSTKEKIVGHVDDIVSDLLYYDRKEDQEFPPGSIEQFIIDGVITVDEIVAVFREIIEQSVKNVRDDKN